LSFIVYNDFINKNQLVEEQGESVTVFLTYGNTEYGERATCRSRHLFPKGTAGMQENILHIVIFQNHEKWSATVLFFFVSMTFGKPRCLPWFFY
jgi:hypothetical protein